MSDAPRFAWRALLIDVSRHFFGKPTMLKFIDEMARYKLNVLQLHLTDDPGWRLEIPAYPKLTEVGALDAATGKRQYFTPGRHSRDRRLRGRAAHHGRARDRDARPFGSEARAYPEFFDKEGRWNPGKPETYKFIQSLFGRGRERCSRRPTFTSAATRSAKGHGRACPRSSS